MTAVLAAPPDVIRAHAYLRISLDQTGEGAGVDRQEWDVRRLCEDLGWSLEQVHTDNDVSATKAKVRPAYEDLLAAIQRGEVDAVVAFHTDRLYRRTTDLERLVAVLDGHHVRVRCVQSGDLDLSTASGRMVARILGATAQHESERLGERVAAKHAANARAGMAHGGPRPYGYERAGPGELTVVPEEAAIVREMTDRVLAGATLRSLAMDLTAREVPTVKGATRWAPTTLRGVLVSPRLAGLVSLSGEAYAKGGWTPILDETTWRRLVAVLERPRRGRTPRTALLAGLAVCDLCGTRLSSGWKRNKNAAPRRILQCRNDGVNTGCGRVSVSAEPLEELVAAWVWQRASLVDLSHARSADAEVLAGRVADDEALLSELARDYARGSIRRAEWTAARQVVDERLAEARSALGARSSSVLDDVGDLRAAWPDLSFDAKREAVSMFVQEVRVAPAGRPGPVFRPERVTILPR